MSTYPVPGEWFDELPHQYADDDDDYDYTVPDPAHFDDDPDAPRRPSYSSGRVQLDPSSVAVQSLRQLSRELKKDRHPLAHVPNDIARVLIDNHVPTPALPAQKQPSPTGNCRQCGDALPLPSMRRGRPRTLRLTCSPSRR